MTKGTITRLTAGQGYGLIRTEDEGVILFYFHRSELQGVAYESLTEGQEVEFEVINTLKGVKAVNVRLARQIRCSGSS